MYRHDPQLTGRSQFVGPNMGLIIDTIYHSEYYSDSEVSIGFDDIVYFATSSTGTIQSYKYPEKSLQWKIPLSTRESFNTPTILSDSGIVHISRTGIRRILKNGTVVWHLPLDGAADGLVTQVDKEGNIYCLGFNQKLYKISPAGSIVWSITDSRFYWGAGSAYPFSPDGRTLYLRALNEVSLIAIDVINGTIVWTYGTEAIVSTPIVDNQGNIYIHLVSDSAATGALHSIKANGLQRWKYIFPIDGFYYDIDANATIDTKGNLYFGTDTLYSLTKDGIIRWKYPIGPLEGLGSPGIICDVEGNVYFSTKNKRIVSLTVDAIPRWSITIREPYINYLSLTNGKLLITGNTNRIYIIE